MWLVVRAAEAATIVAVVAGAVVFLVVLGGAVVAATPRPGPAAPDDAEVPHGEEGRPVANLPPGG